MLYSEDLCRVFLTILGRLASGKHQGLLGNAFNLGTGECVTMEAVVCTIASILSSPLPPERRLSPVKNEIPVQCMDYSKAAQRLGFRPSFSLEQGLAQTVRWWQQYLSHQEASL